MKPSTVLVTTGCDLKRLPLDASEVFLLSRLDGSSTLEEIGEIVGFDFEKARRLAERLIILGAAKPLGSNSEKRPAASPATTVVRKRFDPRSDDEDTTSHDDTFQARSPAPAKPAPAKPAPAKPAPSPPPQKRRSTKSMKAQRAVAPAPEVCELDDDTQAKIRELDAKLKSADYYEALGVARDADKKDIKRAYFELAGRWHPDRFFGKKLGPLRVPLDNVFVRLTDANDALSSRAKREAYDATLPPLPQSTKKKTMAPPRMTPLPQSTKKKTMAPPRMTPPPVSRSSQQRKMSKRLRKSQLLGAVVVKAPVITAPSNEKLKELQAKAKDLASRVRAEPWIKAAEDAVKSGDIMGAANNYRLALQMHEDPVTREKLDAIDRQSRDLRAEKYLMRARAAERGDHWADAAINFVHANEARRDATTAERAAYCLLRSNGDLRQAAALAEQAVAASKKNADYRVTLGEIYFTSKLLVRAREECDAALDLQSDHLRAKALLAAIKKST